MQNIIYIMGYFLIGTILSVVSSFTCQYTTIFLRISVTLFWFPYAIWGFIGYVGDYISMMPANRASSKLTKKLRKAREQEQEEKEKT